MDITTFSSMLLNLKRIELKLTKQFEKDTGFSLTRYQILHYLLANPNRLQTEIAQYLGIDPAAVTRHLKILEEKNYIARRRNENNAREVIVSLTAFGTEEMHNCQARSANNPLHFDLPMPSKDLEILIKHLNTLDKNL